MIILDYWSGNPRHVKQFWSPNYGLQALREHVAAEVDNVIIHAFDPLEITEQGTEEKKWTVFHYHNTYGTLPTGIDIICALHPNPGVIFEQRWYGHDEETFQYNRYLPLLSEVIGEHAEEWAKVVLQFDDCLDEECRDTGGQVFIDRLNRYWAHYNYRLSPIKPLSVRPSLPSSIYKFSSFHLFEKQSLEN